MRGGLRDRDQAQGLAGGEADGAGSFYLAVRNAEDAGADDLGDEAPV